MKPFVRQFHLLLALARPAVVILLGLFTALGLASVGHANDRFLLAEVLVIGLAYLLFSVVVNDLADQAIDCVNLPGDRRRPLVVGTACRSEFVVIAATAAAVALGGAVLLGWREVAVVAAGLAVSAAYSLPPIRLAQRGVVASLVLPACYVAVPFLLGVFRVGTSLPRTALVLLAGLYVGFIGRILLKDFRDVRGDALFGKRTFLVRHGRRRTCAMSAVFLITGMILVNAIRGATPALLAANVIYLTITMVLLRALSVERCARRDEALISAIAIMGRATLVTLLAHFSMIAAGWSSMAYQAGLAALVATMVGQALVMARRGPSTRLTVPPGMAAELQVAVTPQPLDLVSAP
jgi:4-hydroxybenzoate polyprenyltransferase